MKKKEGKIRGKDNISRYWQDLIEKEWRILERRYRSKPVRMKLFMTLLHLLNYKYRPRMEIDDPNYPIGDEMQRFRILLHILEEMIRHEWTQVDFSLKYHEIVIFEEKIWRDFQRLGWLKHNQEGTSKRREMEKYSGAKERDEELKDIDIAFDDWQRCYIKHDSEWIDYYDNESTIGRKLQNLVKKEMEEKIGFSQNALFIFNKRISDRIGNDIKVWMGGKKRPFGYITKEKILDDIRRQALKNPVIENIDNETAMNFLKEIEYELGRRWSRSPFVKFKSNKEELYIPIFYYLYKFQIFSSSWLDHIIKKTRSEGLISNHWGKLFENYVRGKLMDFQTSLTVLPTNLVITPKDFPDIKECLGTIDKTEIEIDVVAYTESKLFLISCKSRGSYSSPDMMKNLYFLDFQDLDEEIDEDFRMSGEIENYAKCVKKSKMFLKSKGFENKEIVPLLVTATCRPLSLESVRSILPEYRIIPEVQIIQSKNLAMVEFE